MKPVLVIGLGNPLMGDDGIGCHAAERLAADPRLPSEVEVIPGGTDLLRCSGQVEGRRRVVVIDAIAGDGPPGEVCPVDIANPGPAGDQEHVHHLSAAQAAALLEIVTGIPITFLGIAVQAAALRPGLSPALEDRLPRIIDRLLQEL